MCEVFIRRAERKSRQRRRDGEHAHLSKQTNGNWKYFRSTPKRALHSYKPYDGTRDRYLSHNQTMVFDCSATIDRLFIEMDRRHLIGVFERDTHTGSNANAVSMAYYW